MNDGSSMIWLLTYYLTGAYIGKYIKIKFGYKKFIFCSIIVSVFIISTFIYCILYINKLYKGKTYLFKKIMYTLRYISTDRYNRVIRVFQSISITLFFLQINYNKYTNNIIFYTHHSFSHNKVCVCAIGKEENKYAREFVEHYKKYGIVMVKIFMEF